MRRLLLALFLVVLTGRAAWAGPFEEARAAEERYEFAEALALYAQVPQGAERAAWLRARDEGYFGPLGQLERVRRDPTAEVDTLVMFADEFPEGLVRVEAWVFAAEVYDRNGRTPEAIPLWRKAARDPKADTVLAHAAIKAAVRAHLAAGDLDAAKLDLQWLDDQAAARDIARAVRRRWLHYACIAIVVLVLLVAGRRVNGASLRRSAKLVLGFAAFVALGGAALASGYEGASAAPFFWFGAIFRR